MKHLLDRFVTKQIAARIRERLPKEPSLHNTKAVSILGTSILALEKVMKARRSFLMADEVGMGKTIEAGLVLQEKKLREKSNEFTHSPRVLCNNGKVR